jgi:hypothetical protein
MNWEAIGAVGEVAGAVGVIITLAYLAVQIRNSSRATESQVHASLASEMERLLVALSQNDPLVEVVTLAQRGEKLTEVQAIKLLSWFNGFLRVCESHIVQWKLDATRIAIDKPISKILRQFGQTPFFRDVMRELVQNRTATDEFLDWLDSEVLAHLSE